MPESKWGGVVFDKLPLSQTAASVSNGGSVPDNTALKDGVGVYVSAFGEEGKPDFRAMNQALLEAGEGEVVADVSPELFAQPDGAQNSGPYLSCKDILNNGAATGNGVYTIDPDGPSGPAGEIQVYCDMTTDGGGWTLVVAVFEQDNLSHNWNEGIQPDYDPTLVSKRTFTLNSIELPTDRTQVAFGKDLNPTAVDYADFIYTTGDIAKTLLTGYKTGSGYHIHRNQGAYYNGHDPENSTGTYSEWYNTLTFNATGGNGYNWAFSPNAIYNKPAGKGHSILGTNLATSLDSFAWTVWVR